MKKLFEIDNNERQRILEMHTNATKKNYLIEQNDRPVGVEGKFAYVKGAKGHSDESKIEAEKLGKQYFGTDKFETIQVNSGWALVKNDALQKIDLMSKTESPIENDEGLNYDYETKRIMYKKSNGVETPVSDSNSLYQKMKKHISQGGGSTAANVAFNKAQEVKNFYDNPSNSTFLELCNNLNPQSVFHMYGFPGISGKCGRLNLGLSELQNKLEPTEYMIVQDKQ